MPICQGVPISAERCQRYPVVAAGTIPNLVVHPDALRLYGAFRRCHVRAKAGVWSSKSRQPPVGACREEDGGNPRRAPGKRELFGTCPNKRLGRCHRRRWAALASGYIPGLLLTSVLIPNRLRHHRRQPRIVVYDPPG